MLLITRGTSQVHTRGACNRLKNWPVITTANVEGRCPTVNDGSDLRTPNPLARRPPVAIDPALTGTPHGGIPNIDRPR
jgi:hypothetical protein